MSDFDFGYFTRQADVDAAREYETLKKHMALGDKGSRDPEAVRRALDGAAYDVHMARRIAIRARREYEWFRDTEYLRELGELKRAAELSLNNAKIEGDLRKQITKDAVMEFVARNSELRPKYEELHKKLLDLEMVAEDLAAHADAFTGRHADLRRIADMNAAEGGK